MSRIYCIRESREGCTLTDNNKEKNKENNAEDNKNKGKRFKWISILIILFLLLFIGSAGYYLESGLQPLDEDQIAEGNDRGEDGSFGDSEEDSLLDRMMGILNLNDREFTQDLDILFVGLDDKDSVAIGEIEADSIMLAKIRPQENSIIIENIDEDTKYQEKTLRKYHDGDLEKAVENIRGAQFDHYVYLHYQGFEKVIDELGGVKINLSEKINVPGLGLNLKAGDNLLSGKEALNFVRWNETNTNARLERQKKLIEAVIAKIRGNNILFNVKDIYNTVVNSYNSVETDIETVLAVELFNYFKGNRNIDILFEN